MRKWVVAGSRSGTPPSRAISIRCLAVMFMAASSRGIGQDLLGRQAVARFDPDGYPAPLNGRHVGRRGARIGDHFLDLFDPERLAQGPLTELRVVHQQHHPRRLFGNDLLDANGGDRRLERAFVRQNPLVEKKATLTKNRRAASSAVGPTRQAVAASNWPPSAKTVCVFSGIRPNSMHSKAEWVTTVTPRNVLANCRARTRQVVLPSRKMV